MLFSIPIHSGGASYGLSGQYFVYLNNEGPAVRAERPQRAAGPGTENAAEAVVKSTVSVEEHLQTNPLQADIKAAAIIEPAPVMQELSTALFQEGTGQGPVSERNDVKQGTAENEKISQPASQNKVEITEKADLPEKAFLAARDLPDENIASGSGRINRSEKNLDIPAEESLPTMDAKAVLTAVRQRDQRNALPREEMPAPAMKQKETEKEVKIQAMTSPDLHQKVVPKIVQAELVAPETRKEVAAYSGPKKITSQKFPDNRVSSGPKLSDSEEKPLKNIALTTGVSPEMTTLPATKEKTVSQVSEKVGTTNPPALQAENAERNNDPKADLAVAKQVAESAGKIVPPKPVTIPGESAVKKEIKTEDAEERRPGKDHFLIKGNEKPLARHIDQDVHGTKPFLPEVSSGGEKAAAHKKNAGGDKAIVTDIKQTIQKMDEAVGTHNDQIKRIPDGKVSQKPDRELQASGGGNISLVRLAGSETGKNGATLRLESKLPGQFESALAGSSERLPAKGTEDKQMQPSAVEGPAKAGGSEAKVSSATLNRPPSVMTKTAGLESAVLADREKEAEKGGIAIPVSEALIQKDIRIEVFTKGMDMPEVFTKLFKKTHPRLRSRRDRERQEPVEGAFEKTISKGTDKTGARHLLSVTKAEKAAYTFVLENKGEQARTVDVIFHFYEGREKKRDKKYNSSELAPGGMLRFTFIMPEGIFWDDEDRFSGRVEDSRTITKFDNESGLVWKEEKGY